MLTPNLLVTTMAAYNKVDDFLLHHPDRSKMIKTALKSRKFNHDNYLNDIKSFNVRRYFEDLGHRTEDLDPEEPESEDELETDDDEI